MQQYLIDFFKSRKKDPTDYIQCERCKQAPCCDVHHINQCFRGKRKHKKDWSDLIGLCRKCHDYVGSNNTFDMRESLLEKVKKVLFDLKNI